jgi:nucleoid-associated protein YgaU
VAVIQVTRLHLLIAGIGVICLFWGTLTWLGQREDAMGHAALTQAHVKPTGQEVQTPANSEEARRKTAATIATVGEAYRVLCKQFGELPPVAKPLRAAKRYQAEGKTDLAIASASEAWKVIKAFRSKAGSMMQTYQVARGDTLWRIAAVHSPVHDGAGWVTIWKANQDRVSNFNRIEIGWTLTIPQKRTQYIMPFWKPQALN